MTLPLTRTYLPLVKKDTFASTTIAITTNATSSEAWLEANIEGQETAPVST